MQKGEGVPSSFSSELNPIAPPMSSSSSVMETHTTNMQFRLQAPNFLFSANAKKVTITKSPVTRDTEPSTKMIIRSACSSSGENGFSILKFGPG